MDEIFDQWWPDLLVLASDEHGRDSDELEVLLGHNDPLEVPVDHIDGEE